MFLVQPLTRYVLGILFLLAVSAQARADIGQIEIRILPESVAYGDHYLLEDIAELDGFDVEAIQKLAKVRIGRSPMAGRSVRISLAQIKSHLRRNFPKKKFDIDIPKNAMISRASIKVSKAQIQNIVLREVNKKYKQFEDTKIKITTRLKDVFIPKGKVSARLGI